MLLFSGNEFTPNNEYKARKTLTQHCHNQRYLRGPRSPATNLYYPRHKAGWQRFRLNLVALDDVLDYLADVWTPPERQTDYLLLSTGVDFIRRSGHLYTNG